jgi:hypothetical protein
MAFPIAGATAVVAGSPRPTGASVLGRNSTSTSGTQVEHTISALMIASPSTGTDPHSLMEGASKRRLIRKARHIRNIRQ